MPRFCGFLFQRSPLFGCSPERPQRLKLRVEGAFQQTLETALILAFANLIFLFHRPTPAIKPRAKRSRRTVQPTTRWIDGGRRWFDPRPAFFPGRPLSHSTYCAQSSTRSGRSCLKTGTDRHSHPPWGQAALSRSVSVPQRLLATQPQIC